VGPMHPQSKLHPLFKLCYGLPPPPERNPPGPTVRKTSPGAAEAGDLQDQ
jgi:hypothetical protein